MLRLLEFFGGKNSSPIFSKLVRARDSNPFILLVGTIKPYNLYYQHFLLRPFLGEIFAVQFHRAKMIEQGETLLYNICSSPSTLSKILKNWFTHLHLNISKVSHKSVDIEILTRSFMYNLISCCIRLTIIRKLKHIHSFFCNDSFMNNTTFHWKLLSTSKVPTTENRKLLKNNDTTRYDMILVWQKCCVSLRLFFFPFILNHETCHLMICVWICVEVGRESRNILSATRNSFVLILIPLSTQQLKLVSPQNCAK